MKFSAAGLVGNRFLLGVRREHWRQLDFSTLSRQLAIPQSLWLRVMQDMEQARAMFFAYEPDIGDGGTIASTWNSCPRPRRCASTACCRWAAATSGIRKMRAWRPSRPIACGISTAAPPSKGICKLIWSGWPCRCSEERPDVIARAAEAADPAGFMFLEVDEADTRRDSFTVTFRGAHLPLRDFIPDLLRLAGSLALPSEVLALLVPDEPRSLYSLAAGTAQDGHEFLTVYYD